MLKLKSLVLGLAFFGNASQAFATTECTQGNAVRKIEIVYADKDEKLPCTVKYTKEDQSEKDVATAKSEKGICEQKSKSLVEKLTGFGWKCEEK